MPAILRLYEDVLSNDSPEVGLPPAPRMIFVVHGSATFEGRAVGNGEAWHGEGELLLRGDSVAFPPGGCAYLHRHQGPGIRCLIEGGIRIDTQGHSTSYGPGSAWYESGPDAVFAQAAADRPSRFIRAMILPRALLGKSSLTLVNDEDKSKPRAQQYKIFVDTPIGFQATES